MLETYFVMVIYGLIVCGNIMLIEAGDSKGEVIEICFESIIQDTFILKVWMVAECHTQRPVNFMTRPQLGNPHHSQAVRMAVFWRVTVQVTRDAL